MEKRFEDLLPQSSATVLGGLKLGNGLTLNTTSGLVDASATSTSWQVNGGPTSPGYKAGQLLHNSIGLDFYYLADITGANATAEPLLLASTADTNVLVHRLAETSVWHYIGNPAGNNVFSGASFSSDNTFGINPQNNMFYSGCQNIVIGDNSFNNTFDSYCNYSKFGNNFQFNTLGSSCTSIVIGQSVQYCRIGDYVNSLIVQDSCNNLTISSGCQYVTFGSSCANVEVYNCSGTLTTPFVIPAGTTNAVYRNNVLVITPIQATSTTLGLVKGGGNVNVNADGSMSVPSLYNVITSAVDGSITPGAVNAALLQLQAPLVLILANGTTSYSNYWDAGPAGSQIRVRGNFTDTSGAPYLTLGGASLVIEAGAVLTCNRLVLGSSGVLTDDNRVTISGPGTLRANITLYTSSGQAVTKVLMTNLRHEGVFINDSGLNMLAADVRWNNVACVPPAGSPYLYPLSRNFAGGSAGCFYFNYRFYQCRFTISGTSGATQAFVNGPVNTVASAFFLSSFNYAGPAATDASDKAGSILEAIGCTFIGDGTSGNKVLSTNGGFATYRFANNTVYGITAPTDASDAGYTAFGIGSAGSGASATTGFNFRGAWAANTLYQSNDAVSYNGATYYNAGAAFTSSAAFVPANWVGFGAGLYTTIDFSQKFVAPSFSGGGGISVSGFPAGRYYELPGGQTALYDPTMAPAAALARLIGTINYYSAPTASELIVNTGNATTATFDGAASLPLIPREWVVLRTTAVGYSIVMRGITGTTGTTAPATATTLGTVRGGGTGNVSINADGSMSANPFTPITQNQYGTHPAFSAQFALNAYLLGGAATVPTTSTPTFTTA